MTESCYQPPEIDKNVLSKRESPENRELSLFGVFFCKNRMFLLTKIININILMIKMTKKREKI